MTGPMFASLHNAVRAAIRERNSLCDISVPRWALTYGTTEQQVMTAWEKIQSELSREASNSYEVEGK